MISINRFFIVDINCELKITPVLEKIKITKLSGQNMQIEWQTTRPPKILKPYKVIGKGRRERPMKRVLDYMGGSPGELSEDLVTQEKRKKGWRMNCDVGVATEGLENEL